MKKSHKIVLIIMCAVSALTVLSVATWFISRPVPTVLQGQVEATQIDVASKIYGRIDQVTVKRGDRVDKGQLLVSIDSPEIMAKLKQAIAAEKAATANRTKAYKGAREEEIRSARDVWQKVKAEADLAEKTFNRILILYRDGVIPEQKRDEAEARWKVARRAQEASKATYDMAVAGTREEDRVAASAMADKASGAFYEAESYLEETRLVAPISGEVIDIIADPGEMISPGYPVVILIDRNDMWVTFNIREDMLENIVMGTILDARLPAFGNRMIQFKVNYIAPLGDFATWHATKASGDFDLRTFEVRAVPVEAVPALRPGMSAILLMDEDK